jgi:hypothetical protein
VLAQAEQLRALLHSSTSMLRGSAKGVGGPRMPAKHSRCAGIVTYVRSASTNRNNWATDVVCRLNKHDADSSAKQTS